MELLQLKYFQTVANYGNMTKAAEALHISQPSLSIMISRLEKELGVKLFDRKGRGIVLNNYGTILLKHTSTALYELEKANRSIEELKEKHGRQLHICMSGAYLSTNLIKSFCKIYNIYQMRQKCCSYREAESMLLKGDCHFAITMPPLQHAQLQSVILYQENLVCFMSKDHLLAVRESIFLQELSNEDFVSTYRSDDAVWQSRNYFANHFGFTPNFVFEGGKEIAQELVAENKGVMLGLLSSSDLHNEKIIAVPVEEAELSFCVGLSRRKDIEMNAASKAFFEYAKQYFSQ